MNITYHNYIAIVPALTPFMHGIPIDNIGLHLEGRNSLIYFYSLCYIYIYISLYTIDPTQYILTQVFT